jgi:virginiamycin B lyase
MITRLDPKTGELVDFTAPNSGFTGAARVHSAVPAPDGSVWLAEQSSNKIGRWDPVTKEITEYQDQFKNNVPYGGGSKHTVRLDPTGNVWGSGSPLTKFDPKIGKFTRFEEVEAAYDVKPDKNGDVWFTGPLASMIGKVDGKTMKVSIWNLPTPDAKPRRLEIAPDGMIWVGEYNGGKMARFDPKTQTFKEYPLPGPSPTPYAMGFDTDGYLWYNSHETDVMARFDTKTGEVIEYPFPHSDITMREFFRDSQGRLWYGTSDNNKVGYFFLTKQTADTASK